jgi:putative holliday junction resolvase
MTNQYLCRSSAARQRANPFHTKVQIKKAITMPGWMLSELANILNDSVMALLYYNGHMPSKLLAIDYGEKRVGVASTDETGEFALPRAVLDNDSVLIDKVLVFVKDAGAEEIIVGDSKNLDGSPNLVSQGIERFVAELRKRGMKVVMHTEVYTSLEAERLQGKTDMLDASAAALILKSYIDTHKND